MNKQQILILVGLAALNVILFCSGGIALVASGVLNAPPATPVAQVLPTTLPSPTTPATQTPAPTETLVIQPPSNASIAILTALAKSRAAGIYQSEMAMSVQGNLGNGATTNQELSLIDMTAAVNGNDSHYTMKGLAAMFLTQDPSKGLEIIDVGGKRYVHGPVALLGAKDARWYIEQGNQSTPKPTFAQDDFLSNNPDLAARFTPAGTAALDGQRCAVYSADQAAALSAFAALSPNTQLTPAQLAQIQSEIQSATFQVWVCGDGYLHQMQITLKGPDKNHPGQTIGFSLFMHLFDFNGPIKIAAPAGALPATPPSLFVTPAPQ